MSNELFAALKAPFAADAIEWRIGQSGKSGEKFWAKVLAYLTARAVMDRLDDVIGPANWKAEYTKAPHDPKGESVLCTLSLRIDGEWIGKADGASASEIEGTKGGISDSLKRAAVCWGVGRYLYSLGESFAECRSEKPPQNERDDWHYAKDKDKNTFYWKAPKLPDWALPVSHQNRPNGTAPRTTPPAHDPPAKSAQDGLSTKDKKTYTACAQILLEAQSESSFLEAFEVMRSATALKTADNPKELKAALWTTAKHHPFAPKHDDDLRILHGLLTKGQAPQGAAA
jgi:hypothetical protein